MSATRSSAGPDPIWDSTSSSSTGAEYIPAPPRESDAESCASSGSKRGASKRAREHQPESSRKRRSQWAPCRSVPSSPMAERRLGEPLEEWRLRSPWRPNERRKRGFVYFDDASESRDAPHVGGDEMVARAWKRARKLDPKGVDSDKRRIFKPPYGEGVYFEEIWRKREARGMKDMPLWSLALRTGHTPRVELFDLSNEIHRTDNPTHRRLFVHHLPITPKNGPDKWLWELYAEPPLVHRYSLRDTRERMARLNRSDRGSSSDEEDA